MIWRQIPEWDRYEVSDAGIVRSRDMLVGAKGASKAVRKGRVLAQAKTSRGYLVVTLTRGCARQQFSVHRLVALAFHGPPPHDKTHVLHSDGDPTNNSAFNLRWGSPADNHVDTERHGRRRRGETHPQAKLSEMAARDIKRSQTKAGVLAAQYGVTREHVWAVRRGRVWAHVLIGK
jgi:hypothetical protein